MKGWVVLVLFAGWCAPLAMAQEAREAPPEDPAHNELRALREKLLDAFNKKDLDALLVHVHPNAAVTWQNAEISRGHQGIRDYYKKMIDGPGHVVEKVTASLEVDEPTILYGDSNGLAFGTMDEDFVLTDGSVFHLNNRWTAHVVKDNGRWVISGLHISANLFDNGVLHMAMRRTATWTGITAGAVGLVLGLLLAWSIIGFQRRRSAARAMP